MQINFKNKRHLKLREKETITKINTVDELIIL